MSNKFEKPSLLSETNVRYSNASQTAEVEGVERWSALGELAKKANEHSYGSQWAYEAHGDTGEYGVGILEDSQGNIVTGRQDTGTMLVLDPVAPEVNGHLYASYIAAANPSVVLELFAALSAVTAERDALRAQAEALHDIGHAIGLPAGLDLTRDLLPVIEALREKADKYATIERIMKMLECDERQGGIWAACSLLLITCAHKMNSARSVVEHECVTAAGEELGNWRVTVERIDAAIDAALSAQGSKHCDGGGA